MDLKRKNKKRQLLCIIPELIYTKKTSFLTTVDEKGSIMAKADLPNDEEIILSYFKKP
jgi:hypothetical protein